MSLDKAIEHGKEHRKQYYDAAKLFDKTCRCHGEDDWSFRDRTHKDVRQKLMYTDTTDAIKELD